MGPGSFPGVKRPGRDADHPPSSSAEDEEGVELYLCSPSGPSWPVLGRTLQLPLPLPTGLIRRFVTFTFEMTPLKFVRLICKLWLQGYALAIGTFQRDCNHFLETIMLSL